MRTFKKQPRQRNIGAFIISILSVALSMWWGMHFPGPVPSSLQAYPTPDSWLQPKPDAARRANHHAPIA